MGQRSIRRADHQAGSRATTPHLQGGRATQSSMTASSRSIDRHESTPSVSLGSVLSSLFRSLCTQTRLIGTDRLVFPGTRSHAYGPVVCTSPPTPLLDFRLFVRGGVQAPGRRSNANQNLLSCGPTRQRSVSGQTVSRLRSLLSTHSFTSHAFTLLLFLSSALTSLASFFLTHPRRGSAARRRRPR